MQIAGRMFISLTEHFHHTVIHDQEDALRDRHTLRGY